MRFRHAFFTVLGLFFVAAAILSLPHKQQPQQHSVLVHKTVQAESPPKTIQGKIIAEFEARQQARDKVLAETFRNAYAEPANTPDDHCLLVPHQVLDPDVKTTAVVKTHSVLVQPPTCSREQHDSGTSRQTGNFNLRGLVPHFGGFHL